jgi:hypothetical protein
MSPSMRLASLVTDLPIIRRFDGPTVGDICLVVSRTGCGVGYGDSPTPGGFDCLYPEPSPLKRASEG